MATRGDARESGHYFSADPFINISRAQAAGMISERARLLVIMNGAYAWPALALRAMSPRG